MITADRIADAAFEADLVGDPFKVLAFARAIEAEALKSQQQAINEAVIAERLACATLCHGLAFEDNTCAGDNPDLMQFYEAIIARPDL